MNYVTYIDSDHKVGYAKREQVPLPMDTQVEDVDTLVRKKFWCLHNDPGTGKTLTALWAWGRIRLLAPKLMIVCPNIALENWITWIGSVFPDANIMHVNKSRSLSIPNHIDVIIVSYGLISSSRTIHTRLRAVRPNVVIIDESDWLSGTDAARTSRVYGGGFQKVGGLVEYAEYVWPLTGTPVRKYYDGLYPVMHSLFKPLLVSYGLERWYKFRATFCDVQKVRVSNHRVVERIVGFKNSALMKELLTNIATRRTIHDVAEHMPPLTQRDVTIEFEPSVKLTELIREASQANVDFDDPEVTTLNTAIMAAHMQLGIEKAPGVAEYLSGEVKARKQTFLVLYWHTAVRNIIKKELESLGYTCRYIGGDTSTSQDVETVNAFNSGEVDFLFGQIDKMGVALNIQRGGHRAVFAERWWAPTKQDQAYKRLWRMGQIEHVQVDYCRASNNPIEQMLDASQTRKRAAIKELNYD